MFSNMAKPRSGEAQVVGVPPSPGSGGQGGPTTQSH